MAASCRWQERAHHDRHKISWPAYSVGRRQQSSKAAASRSRFLAASGSSSPNYHGKENNVSEMPVIADVDIYMGVVIKYKNRGYMNRRARNMIGEIAGIS